MSRYSKAWEGTKNTLREGYIRTHNLADSSHWSTVGGVGAVVGSIAGSSTAGIAGYDPYAGFGTGALAGLGAGLAFKKYGGNHLLPRIGYTVPGIEYKPQVTLPG